MLRSEGRVGMRVYFGRRHGEKTLGEIVKVNPKNFKVKTLESRGRHRSYRVGSVWTVPPSLCSPASEGRKTTTRREAAYAVDYAREAEAEQAFERLAAFGPGVTVVDVLTGKKYRT